MGWMVTCTVLLLGLVAVVACYERALRNVARSLREREEGSNLRVAVDSASPGLRAVGSAVDEVFSASRRQREHDALERKVFRRDLASLSHDIRTPLAGAIGYLELYETRVSPEDRNRCVAVARERLDAMRGLVDDLFAYSKAIEDPDRVSREPVEVYPLVARVFLGLYPAFSERGWEPTIDFEDEGFTVEADSEALQRVLSNLAANALRHGAGAPRVVQRGRSVVFSNPVEKPSEVDATRLFERFYRSDPARGGGGSGLGLAIVAQLCAAMGMRVWARVEGSGLAIGIDMG